MQKEKAGTYAGADNAELNRISRKQGAMKDLNTEKPENESKKEDCKASKLNRKNMTVWQRDLIFLGGVLIIALVFSHTVLIHGFIPSGSMEPTLMTGDTVLVNGLAYTFHDPERGDIISFKSKETGKTFIKRIIGIAGDEISFHDGYVYINGSPMYEPYIPEEVETNCVKVFAVPEDSYFVLGDNRELSYDSRYWLNPYVKRADIIGKYLGTAWHGKGT